MRYINLDTPFYWFGVYGFDLSERDNQTFPIVDKESGDIFYLELCTARYLEDYTERNYLAAREKKQLSEHFLDMEKGKTDYFLATLEYPSEQYGDVVYYNDLLYGKGGTFSDIRSKKRGPNSATVFVRDLDIFNLTSILALIKRIFKERLSIDGHFEFADIPSKVEIEKEYGIALEQSRHGSYYTLEYMKHVYNITEEQEGDEQ